MFKKMIKLFNIDPFEELSVAGYYWTAFHYACHFLNTKAVEFLIHYTYR